jgi:hypothetical protein
MDDDDNNKNDSNASPQFHEYPSAYDDAVADPPWLDELSDEWISNGGSAEPSEQGSTRGMSIRATYTATPGKIDSIPEEPEHSTIRIALAETHVINTPEWKRRLDEARTTPRDLFSPCHLENIFDDDSTQYG